MSDDQATNGNESSPQQQEDAGASTQQGCGCGPADQSQQAAEAAKAAEQAQAASGHYVYPQVTFTTFVLSLSSSAMVHLGEVPEPETGATQQNLPLAKHTIDILAMLKDKTAKCLDDEESRLLDGVLYELRMVYLMKTK